MRGLTYLLVGAGLAVSALAQEAPKLTARELFYTPVSAAKPKAQAPATPAKPAKRQPSKPARTEVPTPDRPAVADPGEPASRQRQRQSDNEPRLQMVSGLPSLALRYSILKRNDDERYVEVDPEAVFRSGDKIRVSVEANDAAYLYIVQQGSSKTWNVLFPNAEIEGGNNRIERDHQYTIPAGGARFTFDENPGSERLFIIVSRQPEADIEQMIYTLATGEKRESPSSEKPKMLLAAARPLDDGLIARMRSQVLARDLVFEKVDETSAGPKKESAMYVATQDRTPNARIVVDLSLNHR